MEHMDHMKMNESTIQRSNEVQQGVVPTDPTARSVEDYKKIVDSSANNQNVNKGVEKIDDPVFNKHNMDTEVTKSELKKKDVVDNNNKDFKNYHRGL